MASGGAEAGAESIDWEELRAAAREVMRQAYAPYSGFPVGAAALVDDGRIVVGCNVENAGYGMTLCAECGLVSALHAGGGGRLLAMSCVDGNGVLLMPCGRCRQLLWENGGPTCLVDAEGGARSMAELLPLAFGPDDLAGYAGASAGTRGVAAGAVPDRLRDHVGTGTVFVHPDVAAGVQVWTAYWDRSDALVAGTAGGAPAQSERRGVLEEGPSWPTTDQAIGWGLARTPSVVVVDTEGDLAWAGEAEPPAAVPGRWTGGDQS